jgi:hypothetical protein
MIVPGGGISLDGTCWVPSRPAFLLPVRVLSKLFRRLFLTRLLELHAAGRLAFFGGHAGLREERAFPRLITRPRKKNWVVYVKPPFGGPEAVLAYLSRYTHRVAISNRRLISLDERGVTFRYKDYRRDGAARYRAMTLATDEFIRRFPLHVLPKGFHRIRYHGLLASAGRQANVSRARAFLAVPPVAEPAEPVEPTEPRLSCPCRGGHMIIIETFQRWTQPSAPPVCPAPTGTVTRRPGTAHANAMSLPCRIGHRYAARPTAGPHRSARRSRTPSPILPASGRGSAPQSPGKTSGMAIPKSTVNAKPVTPGTTKPHKPRTRHRGFVPRGLSGARRRPKLFTIAEWRLWAEMAKSWPVQLAASRRCLTPANIRSGFLKDARRYADPA